MWQMNLKSLFSGSSSMASACVGSLALLDAGTGFLDLFFFLENNETESYLIHKMYWRDRRYIENELSFH